MTVPVALIAAVAANGVIGADNAMPWHLPSDFAHFKRTTMGKPLIMGRRTFESIGRPLPGRTTIVVTRRQGYRPPGAHVAHSLPEALELAQNVAADTHVGEVMVAGGGEIYREAMPHAQRLYVTHVDLSPAGDTVFPVIDPGMWREAGQIDIPRSSQDTADFRVVAYERS